MQEQLVDRAKTEKGQTKFLKKIGKDEQFDKWTASLSEFLCFILFLPKSTTAFDSVSLNFYLFCFNYSNRS